DLHEQHLAALGRQRERERRGDRGLARSPLAGDDVQPHALPVGVPRPHHYEAICAREADQPGGSASGGSAWPGRRPGRGRRGLCTGGLSLGWGWECGTFFVGEEVFPMEVLGILLVILIILIIGGAVVAARSLKVVQQYEQALIFRFGKVLPGTRGPGLTVIRPIGDRLQKVNMQIVAMAVPAQEGITRDNVTVRVDAVVYFRVV